MERTIKRLLVLAGILMSGAAALAPLTSYAAVTNTLPDYARTPYNCKDDAPSEEQYVVYEGDEGTGAGREVWGITDANNGCPSTSGQMEVNVNIFDLLIVDVVTTPKSIPVATNSYGQGITAVTVSVRTPQAYTLSLSAANPYLMETINGVSGIQPRSGDLKDFVAKGVNGWGMRLHKGDVEIKTDENGNKTVGTTNVVTDEPAADDEETEDDTAGYMGLTYAPTVFFKSEVPDDPSASINGYEHTTGFDVGVAINSHVPMGTYATEVTITAALATE